MKKREQEKKQNQKQPASAAIDGGKGYLLDHQWIANMVATCTNKPYCSKNGWVGGAIPPPPPPSPVLQHGNGDGDPGDAGRSNRIGARPADRGIPAAELPDLSLVTSGGIPSASS